MIKAIALLTPIYVTLLWSLIIFIQKGSIAKPKAYIGLVMIFAFLLYCSHAIFFNNLYHLYSFIDSIYIISMLSVYPLYYIYIRFVTTEGISFKQQLIHFLPAAFLGILSIALTLVLTKDERIFYVRDTLIDKNLKELNLTTLVGIKGTVFLVSRLTMMVHVVFYVAAVIKRVNIHKKRIINYYSDTEGKTLNWVKDVSIAMWIIAVASIGFAIIGRSYFTKHEISLLIPSLIFSSLLFVLGYKGNQQIQISNEIIEKSEEEVEFEEIKTKQEEELKRQLTRLFEQDKVYKLPDLRITTVTKSLKTNRTYISKLINDQFDMNFNEFVNRYRIEEAKILLRNKDNNLYSMDYIAERSGFGSVNSFTRVFKELEGITPGRFRESKTEFLL
ncbi:MAG: helix-turn-helix transcriptional regulator [Bacteroidota bacterium]